MTSKKILILVLFFPFLFNNCSNNSLGIDGNSAGTPLSFGNQASKNFTGQIVDESNNPVSNVAITVANKTATTDVNGVFIINSAMVSEKFAFVKAKKAGYLDGSRSLVPTSGMNNVKITLLSGTIVGTVNSGQIGNVALSNGSKVTFDGNFETEAGQTDGTLAHAIEHIFYYSCELAGYTHINTIAPTLQDTDFKRKHSIGELDLHSSRLLA
jgi:hypothetical protein